MYILGKKSLHFSNVDLTNKTNPSTELAYNKVMEISNGSVRNILFYRSQKHLILQEPYTLLYVNYSLAHTSVH